MPQPAWTAVWLRPFSPSATLLRCYRPVGFPVYRVCTPWRNLDHVHVRFAQNAAAAARQPSKPPSPSSSAPAPTPNIIDRSFSYAQQLARMKEPPVIYRSPPHKLYRASCFTSGLFCITYVGYNYMTSVLNPPPGHVWWLPHAFAVIVVAMGAMGGYFWTGGWRLIRVIRVVPRTAGSNPAPSAKAQPRGRMTAAQRSAALADAALSRLPVELEIHATRLMPFLPPKVIRVHPSDVVLPDRFVILRHMGEHVKDPELAKQNLTIREQLQAIKDAKARAVAEAEYDKRNLLTSPFRHLAAAFGKVFRALHRSLTRAGFVSIEIKGKTYKLDVMDSWALEDGRALDRLVALKPRSRAQSAITTLPPSSPQQRPR